MSEVLEKGPMEEDPQESQEAQELAPPEKPYEEMTQEELFARMQVERRHTMKLKGVTEERIAQWKEQYKRVGSIVIGDMVFVYRPLRRIEKRNLTKKSLQHQELWRKDLDFAEEVVAVCTLHPSLSITVLRNEIYDGVVEELANAIMSLSGHGAGVSIVEL